MSKQLTCDICGGQIVMQGGGRASCEICGTVYSTERLREKAQALNLGGTPTAGSTTPCSNANNPRNMVSIMESYVRVGSFDKAAECVKSILAADIGNVDAWCCKMKLLGEYYKRIEGISFHDCAQNVVKCYKEAREFVRGEQNISRLEREFREALEKAAGWVNTSRILECADELQRISPSNVAVLLRVYLRSRPKGNYNVYDAKRLANNVAEIWIKYHHVYPMEHDIMAVYAHLKKKFPDYNGYTDDIYDKETYIAEAIRREKREQEAKARAQKQEAERQQRIRAAEEEKRRKAQEEADRAARVARYWEEHAQEKAEIESKIRALETERSGLGAKIAEEKKGIRATFDTLPEHELLQKTSERIEALTTKIQGLGFFAFTEKKLTNQELERQINEKERIQQTINNAIRTRDRDLEEATKRLRSETTRIEIAINELKKEFTKER